MLKSCYYHIKDICRLRHILDRSVITKLSNALVSSRLDYCNSLFFSLTETNLNRLQRVQNTLGRVIARLPRRANVSSVLKSLHWLPVRHRVKFKTCVLIYKTLSWGKPSYLKTHLEPYTSTRFTRQSDPSKLLLAIPYFKRGFHLSKVHLEHSFSYSAPRLWNKLPWHVSAAPSFSTFRSRLKAHLFSLAYPT